jgi:SAM-dependent methyltransferase
MINNENTVNKVYNKWFDSPYYHILYENRDYKEAKKFVKTILNHLKLKNRSFILDAACGKGRHSIELEKLGYKVLGIDLSKNSINIAKKNENKNLNFLVHDISIPLKKKFDAVFNLFTSFGYYDKKKDVQILKTIEKNLKINGVGVIDFFNVNKVKNELIENEIINKKNIKFNINRKINRNCVTKKIIVEDNFKKYVFFEKVNTLTVNDFKNYFKKTNLEIIEFFGNYKLDKFDLNCSPRLIIIFKKKSQSNK